MNDTHGHERGDLVLREVAYEIRKSLRSFELVYRVGGEEFLVLLPGASSAGRSRSRSASGVRSRAQARRARADAVGGGGRPRAAADQYEELFRAADEALLRAKRAGRDRVEVAGRCRRS